MAGTEPRRKLAAIFSADVQGYSRLMGEDELATLETLKTHRSVIAEFVRRHAGHVVSSPGDNLLAEFPSVVDAVQCAVESQQSLAIKNATLPPSRRMAFRIGINLGDVIEDSDDIFGDGVNIAARLESLAEGGGICISGSAYDQVENKLPLNYEFIGEQEVKNIAKPVRAYRVYVGQPSATAAANSAQPGKVQRRSTRLTVTIAGLALLIVAGGVWYFFAQRIQVFDVATVQATVHALPTKTAIAVLPFTNLSADPAQEYFSHGMTNDLITDLSKFHDLYVISSNTVFTYKGKAADVEAVGRQLGVRYVLEGSVQKTADKVRVNAQLIDTTTAHHLWAERYERKLDDLFAVQSEIIQMIVRTLAIKISAAERQRVIKKGTENLSAYDFTLRGTEYLRQRSRTANRQARAMFENALRLDPSYSTAYARLGESHYRAFLHGWSEFPLQDLNRAADLASKALNLDGANAAAHGLTGYVDIVRGRHEEAVHALQRAIALNPNDIRHYIMLGWVLQLAGQTDDAIKLLETALRVDPHSLVDPFAYTHLGFAYYLKSDYENAERALRKALVLTPDYAGTHIALAATYGQLGRSRDAVSARELVMRHQPFFNLKRYGSAYRNPQDRELILQGLRKAGFK